mmetsp:Transcript_35393/g.94883  ORF Transcript_35393/g.94883 Transcript_35393/m.94883 type:complete len:244 (-) Transcript_35393:557-1288(-)
MCRIDSSLTWTQRAAHTTLPGTPQPLRQWMGLVVIFPTTRARNTRVRRRAQTPTCAPTVRDDSIFYRRRHGHTHRQRHCRTVPELLQIFPITTAVTSVSSAVTVAASAPQPESLPPTDLVSLFDELKRIDSTGSMGIRPGSITPSVSPINQAAPELTAAHPHAHSQGRGNAPQRAQATPTVVPYGSPQTSTSISTGGIRGSVAVADWRARAAAPSGPPPPAWPPAPHDINLAPLCWPLAGVCF